MNRRDFMNWIGVGAMATSLPVAIAACTPKSEPSTETPTQPATPPSAADFKSIGTTAELSQQGYLSSAATFDEPVIVIQDPNDTNALIALSSKCTHSGCDVAWQEDLFACPCHGSKFNPDGSVVTGPAKSPLKAYAAKIEGESVLVTST